MFNVPLLSISVFAFSLTNLLDFNVTVLSALTPIEPCLLVNASSSVPVILLVPNSILSSVVTDVFLPNNEALFSSDIDLDTVVIFSVAVACVLSKPILPRAAVKAIFLALSFEFL